MGKRNKEYHAQVLRELRAWYAEHGICPGCGRNEPAPGRKYCEECHARDRARWAENRDKRNAQRKAMLDDRRAKGLCVHCGKPATPGMVMCERCRRMRNDSTRKYKIKQRINKEVEALVKRSQQRTYQPSDQAVRGARTAKGAAQESS